MLSHTFSHPGSEGLVPTLIALHGYGSHAYDLVGLAPMLAGGRLLVICPQSPHRIEADVVGYSWAEGDVDGRTAASSIATSAQQVLAFMDTAVQQYPIDPERLVLLGFSQGGVVAAHAALTAPGRFAGLVLLSTTTDEERMGKLPVSPEAKRLPILIQHGASDPTIPIIEAFSTSMLLQGQGLQAELQQFPMRHEVSLESAESLSNWLAKVLRMPE